MTHEFLSIKGGQGIDDADPGIMTVNGTGFNASFLQQMFGYDEENTAGNTPWFPFDRGIQVPTPTTWDNGVSKQWGLYYWNRNQIMQLNGTTDNWVDIFTVADQQNIWDYGIHTGLYEVYGSDGKLYVCGIYPGVTFNNMGAIKLDVETGVWSDTGQQSLGFQFTNCTYCISWNERLWLATQNRLISYDPVSGNIEVETISGDGRPDQKPLILGQRFFVCTEHVNRLKVWERIGGTWVEMADLGQITHDADALFDYVLTETQAIFFFNSVETISGTPKSGLRAVEVTTVDPSPGGALIVDEVTETVLAGDANIFHEDLNTLPSIVFWSAADSSAFPDQAAQVNLYRQSFTGYPEAWATQRWINKSSALGSLGPTFGGNNSYVSCKDGAGGRIFSADILPTTQRKIVVYKVEPADLVVEDGLLVSFWAFGDVGTGQVRIRRSYAVFPVGSVIRVNRGTIHSVVSGGTLFNFTQINNVPVDKNGGGVHQFIWDRNNDAQAPWLAYALSVELSD